MPKPPRFLPEELVARCEHLISECKHVAEHCRFQAELREFYGSVDASYRDEESQKLILRKRLWLRANLKAAEKAQRILNSVRRGLGPTS